MCAGSHVDVMPRGLPYSLAFCHYNAEMPRGGVVWSSGKSFVMAMIVLGCSVIPQAVTAQAAAGQSSSAKLDPAEPDSAKPALAVLPTAQPAAVAPPPHAFWDRTNIALFSGIAFTRGIGLCFHAQLPGPWTARDSAARRCG